MKTFLNVLTLLTAMTLVAGVTSAMADQQRSDEAATYAPRSVSGPYASARVGGQIHNSTIDFQATGSR